MTAEAQRRVLARLGRVAADGTDPQLLLAVLGHLVQPRRAPDGLRRACRDLPGEGAPAARLRQVLRPVRDEPAAAVDRLIRPWIELDARVAVVGDPAFPERLAAGWPHTDGPTLLAWRGRPPGDGPAVALVGARRATGYGTAVAAWLAESAAGAGVHVVSGGALGIDAAAHRASLELPGRSTVVLGCGHSVPYPRAHAVRGGLFDQILDHGGGLVSELLPSARPVPGHVRARNRIVAGLVDAVVVVEGGPTSGALLTASAAAERGIVVLAVPGDVRAPGSAAPHRLLRDGAAPCTEPTDLLEALGHRPGEPDAEVAAQPTGLQASALPDDVRRLLVAAWPRPVPVDELAAAADRPTAALLGALVRSRLAGEVAEGPDGIRLRRAP